MIKIFDLIRKSNRMGKNMNVTPLVFQKHPIYILVILLLFLNCETKNELPDPLEAGWNNQTICRVIEENESVRVLKCTFPPGYGHERHYHKAHFGYTIAGSTFRMKDTTGVRDVVVPTGTDFYNDGIEWHEVLNIGDSTAVFLIVEPK